jgi:hypothetical protein
MGTAQHEKPNQWEPIDHETSAERWIIIRVRLCSNKANHVQDAV